jgi:4-diphosphocytidyl-2-C-methyl-D-erythritol kinase
MIIYAPAKVNLFLEITGRRPDGYHTLASIMQTVSLYDRLTITPRQSGITLRCNNPSLPVDERNLVVKAALRLQETLGTTAGAAITLEKNIPMGAGLGGGSSDAAAVLNGLLKLWKRRLPQEQLVTLAAGLGADVPFFLSGGTALARGIGDRLTPLPTVRPTALVLVYPGFGVATAGVYKQVRFPLTKPKKINKIKHLLEQKAPAQIWAPYLYNRLEDIVLPQQEKIRELKDQVASYGCPALMSGSGSTVFGITASLKQATLIASRIKQRSGGVWAVRTVS